MECRSIREKLSAYIDDLLSPEEKVVIDEHLKSCRECSTALYDLKKTIEYARNLETVEPPAWLTQRTMVRVRAEARPRQGLFQRLFYPLHVKLPIGAIATVAIALTTLYVFRTIEPEVKLAKAPTEEVAPQILQKEIIKEDRVRPLTKSGEGKPPQEITTAPEKLSEAVVRGKTEVKADKLEEASTGKARPERSDTSPEPAPQKAQERISAAGALARDEARQAAGAATPKAKLSYMEKQEQEPMILTVFVKDPEAAGKEIEKTLRELEGKVIRTESVKEKRTVTAEINSTNLKNLIEKLRAVGQVKERKIDFEAVKGEMKVRIEVVEIFEGR